jgi:hypothetical protein
MTPGGFTANFSGLGLPPSNLASFDWTAMAAPNFGLDVSVWFAGPGTHEGRLMMNVVSVTVPEPTTITTLGAGVLLFAIWAGKRWRTTEGSSL